MELDFRELNHLKVILDAYDIYKNCMYMPTKEKYEKKIKSFMANERIRICACLHCGNIKGIIAILFCECNKAEIVGVAVDEGVRGQGAGSYMVQQIKDKYNIEELYAETDEEAVMFYKKTGFKITKNAKNYNGQNVIRYNCVLK